MKSQRKTHIAKHFYLHMIRNTLWSLILTTIALCIGMEGYHLTEKMPWIDSFMNASMILSGMGPATTINTTPGKLFAGFYALFSGLAFIAIIVIILSPVLHQFFRRIHLESGRANNN